MTCSADCYAGVDFITRPSEKYTQGQKISVDILPNVSSYTMVCLPVRGDNPRALATGLSYVQVDSHGITILYHPEISQGF